MRFVNLQNFCIDCGSDVTWERCGNPSSTLKATCSCGSQTFLYGEVGQPIIAVKPQDVEK